MVTPHFAPATGGLETYTYNLAVRLRDEYGWRVVVVTSGSLHAADVTETVDGLKVHRLGTQFRLSNTPLSFRWLSGLQTIVGTEKPSVVNAHAPVVGLLDLTARACGGAPLVVSYHAGSMLKRRLGYEDCLIWPYERFILPRTLGKAALITCSSDFVRFEFLSKWLNKTRTVTPAIDARLFPVSHSLAHNGSVVVVGGMKRGERHKGLQEALETVATLRHEVSQLSLTVIGDGEHRSRFEVMARRLGLEDIVTFTGTLASFEVAAELRKSNVFLLPTRNDSLPLVLLEAMASGLPIVATAVGGIPALVTPNDNGLLVEPGDRKGLSRALLRLLNDRALADKMHDRNARKVTESYSLQCQAEQFAALLESVLQQSTIYATTRRAR